MSFSVPPKKHINKSVIGSAYCTNPKNCVFLKLGYNYNIIDISKNKVLIRFRSGGAKWYLKNRFTTHLKIKKMGLEKIKLEQTKSKTISDLKPGTLIETGNSCIYMILDCQLINYKEAVNISTGKASYFSSTYNNFVLVKDKKKFIYKAKTT